MVSRIDGSSVSCQNLEPGYFGDPSFRYFLYQLNTNLPLGHTLLPALAFAIAGIIIVSILRTRVSVLILDQPNPRSLHNKAIPLGGGLAITGATIAALLVLGFKPNTWLLTLLPLVMISFLDDWRGLSVVWRLLIHFAVAAIFAILTMGLRDTIFIAPLILIIVWMTNLYNFMDGSDGLAGGMATIGFGFYGLLAWYSNDYPFALANLSIAAAAFAFLLFNFPPARIFMGDSGSIPLGFLAAAMGFLGWQNRTWSLWFPVVVFSPFIIDATVTLVKRLFRGEKIWVAHRSHYYQRLVLRLGHRGVALVEYMLMLACGICAVSSELLPNIQPWLILGLTGFYAFVLFHIDRFNGEATS